MKRRTFIAQTGSLLFLLGTSHIARAASSMLAVRMWPSEDYTRVTIESDWKLETVQFHLSDPDRFVVDIKDMLLNEQFQKMGALVQTSDPYVSAIRVGQFQDDTVRIVFDLKQAAKPNVFTLGPIAEYKNRLVFDFKPIRELDPLNQLSEQILQEQAQAISEGNQNEADILGDWLNQGSGKESSTPPPVATEPTRPTRRPTPSKVPVENEQATPPSRPPSTPSPTPRQRLKIIAIDPGHGGEDPGAIGYKGTYEKNIVLAIGKLLRDQINAQPNMRAFMTRDADFFVPLAKRVEKARHVKADLFISIHADAHTNRKAKGASVFALSDRGASSTTAQLLANKENQSDLIGGIDIRVRDRETANILISMSTATQIKNSLRLGKLVISEIERFTHMHKNNVEQAGFAVLKSPDIPSILVETGFISNPDEEKLLRNTAHQKKIAEALLNAIKKYLI
ncbi:MAG: N-acetylmuramoyl-L-alanine amidase [Saezia sp.]